MPTTMHVPSPSGHVRSADAAPRRIAAPRFLLLLAFLAGLALLAGLADPQPATALTMTPSPTAAASPTPCPACVRLGFASIDAPIIEPLFPRIGETVTMRFRSSCYSPLGCGIDRYSFRSSGPLTGSFPPEEAGGFIVVRRVVADSGTASVGLSVTVATEDQCYAPSPGSSGCSVFFVWGPPIFAESPTTTIRLLDADEPMPPTPTPTLTRTPFPTRTRTATHTATPTRIVVVPPALDPFPARVDSCTLQLHGSIASQGCSTDTELFTSGVEMTDLQIDCTAERFSFGVMLPPSQTTRFDLCRSGDPGEPACVEVVLEQRFLGDCGADGEVTVDEILRAVAIALGEAAAVDCHAADRDEDGTVTVDEILAVTANALDGCR